MLLRAVRRVLVDGATAIAFAAAASALAAAPARAAAAAIAPAGDVPVFWTDCDALWTATRSAGSKTFGAPHKIDTKGPPPNIMRADVGADGTAIVAWKDGHGIYAATAKPPGA